MNPKEANGLKCRNCGSPLTGKKTIFCHPNCRVIYKLKHTDVFANIENKCSRYQAQRDYEGW